MQPTNEPNCHFSPMPSDKRTESSIDESRLESDAVYRFHYVADVIELSSSDFEVLRQHHDFVRPHLEAVVQSVYKKMFQYFPMKRHFLPRQDGFYGHAPDTMDDVSLEHEQTEFRKKKLEEFFSKLSTSSGDETFAVLLDVIGHIHTPFKGNVILAVPIVQITAMLGFIADQFLKMISSLDLPNEERFRLQCAYNKMFWIQNSMFIRHYAAPC